MNPADQKIQEFLGHLATEIIDQGHQLLNGCRNELDKIIAKNANARLIEIKDDPRKRLLCYVSSNCQPVHEFGTILKSRCESWESLASPELEIPETIQQADAVIVVGGQEGTECAANWARIAKKTLLPITRFGGSASAIFDKELKNFDSKYSDFLEKSEYEILNQISSDLSRIAKDAVSLAARALNSREVFVIMSFSKSDKLEDAYDSFETICKEFQYECIRIDNASLTERIIPQIFDRIKKSAFIIADLSEPKPNVYYELGYAKGLNKQIIATACTGTVLPFDVADIPTIFWENQRHLKDQLREKMVQIARTHGR